MDPLHLLQKFFILSLPYKPLAYSVALIVWYKVVQCTLVSSTCTWTVIWAQNSNYFQIPTSCNDTGAFISPTSTSSASNRMGMIMPPATWPSRFSSSTSWLDSSIASHVVKLHLGWQPSGIKNLKITQTHWFFSHGLKNTEFYKHTEKVLHAQLNFKKNSLYYLPHIYDLHTKERVWEEFGQSCMLNPIVLIVWPNCVCQMSCQDQENGFKFPM